jgi:D-isomer specific 2-hydroxyacid dehydrogenase, catalytic domain
VSIPLLTYALLRPVTESRRKKERIIAVRYSNMPDQSVTPRHETASEREPGGFRVGFSADFLDENRQLIFPDIGLSLLDGVAGVSYEFLPEYSPEYLPGQLAEYDVVISLRPKITAKSLEGADRLCAIGRYGVGHDTVDLEACTDSPLVSLDNVILSSHSIAWTDEFFRDVGRIDCEGALAIYRGEAPGHVVNSGVLRRSGFLEKLSRRKAARTGSEGSG